MQCDPKFKRELDQIHLEMSMVYEMAKAEQDMEVTELFDEAVKRGGSYAEGFELGFFRGREILNKWEATVTEERERRFRDFDKRWGLHGLVDDKPMRSEQPPI